MLISPPTDFFFLFSSETQIWFCMSLNLKLIRLLTILQHEILISIIHPLPLFFTEVIHSSRPNSRLIFLMSKQSFQSVLIFSFLKCFMTYVSISYIYMCVCVCVCVWLVSPTKHKLLNSKISV